MAVRHLADPALQPKSFAFTADNRAWAKKQIAKYPEGRQVSAVLPLLWRAQEQAGGWLPEKAIEHVAELLDLPRIRALEVATFYTMFNLAAHRRQRAADLRCPEQGGRRGHRRLDHGEGATVGACASGSAASAASPATSPSRPSWTPPSCPRRRGEFEL